MKRTALILLALAAAAAAETYEERGKRVLDEALRVLGGQKFLEVKDRVERGRVYAFARGQLRGLAVATIYSRYMDHVPGPAEEFTAVEERLSFGKKKEDYAYLYSEGKGWEITFRGARPFPDDRVHRNNEGYRNDILTILRLRRNEPGLYIRSRGSNIVDNQAVETVEIIDAENRSLTVHFNQSSKLPIWQSYTWRDRDNLPVEDATIYSKYRSIDGVTWPYVIQRRRNGEQVFEKFAETVEINTGLDDSHFRLPLKMKILEPMP